MSFVAIAVRSANKNPFSLCQISASLIDGEIEGIDIDILLDPKVNFDRDQIRMHMINARSVKDSPQFGDAFPKIADYLEGRKVISFGPDAHFAFEELCYRTNLKMPQCQWMDLGDVLARSLQLGEELETLGLIEAARKLGVGVPSRVANRWDAADEVTMINLVFSHLIERLRSTRDASALNKAAE